MIPLPPVSLLVASAILPWLSESYPDDAGFAKRVAPTVPALAKADYGKRSLAPSTCPDTGLPVRVWAVKGEEIISPYTGRKYIQGDTGYFGPKSRDAQGRIATFGGDPLKQDLPPCIARLLLDSNDAGVRAFLSIPGNLRQHYHFACVNWARFYPLLADKMDEGWRKDFAAAVAVYREGRRPSDGDNEHVAVRPFAHDLVGEENEFFGGNVADGGTENHKTMWRTSGLLYSQLLGPDARVSSYTSAEAERITTKVLVRGWGDILKAGNGEWDSSSYYPCHVRGFMNLYDFSPKEPTRDMARFALDYYFATYGLKLLNGHFVGAQKRGFVSGFGLQSMDAMCWAYVPATAPASDPILSIHQATTKYRPNRVIRNIMAKNVPLPFEAQMARPTYHLKQKNAFQETFYCDDGLALGSVAMTQEDNPTQQTVWSLGCRAGGGALIFGGGQPRYRSPEGHSRHTQVVQKRGAMVLMTAGEDLRLAPADASPAQRWENAPTAAESWLFVPRGVKTAHEGPGLLILDAGEAWAIVHPIGRVLWLKDSPAPSTQPQKRGTLGAAMEQYSILVAAGQRSGYAIEAVLKKSHPDLAALLARTKDRMHVAAEGPFRVRYTSIAGDTVEAQHEPQGLRATASINGQAVDWSGWANGGVYDSPYVKVKDGRMTLSDGRETYWVEFVEGTPVWRQ